MGAALAKERLSYADIVHRMERSRSEYIRLCRSHYAFINKRFDAANHELLSEFVQGALMRFRGDVERLQRRTAKKAPSPDSVTARTIMLRLTPLINEAPKVRRQVTLVRAHHFDAPPKVGTTFTYQLPLSTSMYHPFSVEWIASRKHPRGYKPFMMIIRVLPGAGGLLCIGCPVPHDCSIEHQRTFRVGPRTRWAYEALTQHQIQNQAEVILAPPVNFKVTGNASFRLRDVQNLNRYGLGWYTNVQNRHVNKDSLIDCVFVDLLR